MTLQEDIDLKGHSTGRSRTQLRCPPGRRHGFTLTEALLAFTGYSILLTFIITMLMMATRGIINTHIAGEIRGYAQAVQLYVKSNYPSLLTSTATGPVQITVGQLQGGGYLLPPLTGNTSGGQTISAVVNQPSSGTLQVIVVASGGGVNTVNAQTIASQIPGLSGYFTSSTTINGIGGTFSNLDFTPYLATGVTPVANAIAVVIYFANGTLVPDYLSRFAVPGSPAANQMQTTLDMNNFKILNALDVTLPGIGQSANQGVYTVSDIPVGTVINKPNCASGMSPEIHVWAESIIEPNGEGWTGQSAYAVDNENNTWTINLTLNTINGTESLGSSNATVGVITKCY